MNPTAVCRVWLQLTDAADYALTAARLWVVDRIRGPSPETPTGAVARRAISFAEPFPILISTT